MGRLVCRAFRCGLGEFHQGFGNMAIAVRMLVQIVLMLVFRTVKVLQRLYFYGQRSLQLAGNPVINPLYGRKIFRVGVVNACAVPGAFVVALPVDAQGIYCPKIELKYPFETDYISFVSDMYCFSISGGIGIYFSVGGVENIAVGITYLGGDHAVDKFQVTLGSPEAAGC